MMKVRAERCENCLFGPKPVVTQKRRKQLLAQLRREDRHFICHLSPVGEQHTCRASFDTGPQLVRIAQRIGAVEFIQPSPKDQT